LTAALYVIALKALAEGSWVWLAVVIAGLAVVIGKARHRPALLLVTGFAALFLAHTLWPGERKARVEEFTGKAVVLRGEVVREPLPAGRGSTFWLEAEEVIYRGKARPTRGKVWVSAPAGVRVASLDRVEITGELEEMRFGREIMQFSLRIGDSRLVRKIGRREEGPIEAAGRRVRTQVVEVLTPVMPGGYRDLHARLLGSLFFGTHGAGLPREITEVFRRSGTIHILVVSGTQISLLFMVVYFPGLLAHWQRRRVIREQLKSFGSDADIWPVAARLPGLPRLLPSAAVVAAGLALMCLYALLTQGGTPVARAAVMAGLIGISLLLRHFSAVADNHSLEIDRYTLLAAAGMGILAFNPEALSEAGFQLSFAAVWGIIFLAPKLRGLLGFMNDFWAYLIAGPVSAQLATLPIVARQFGSVPVVGLISNLVVVPIAAVLLWLGLMTFLLGSIWWPLAWPTGWTCGQLCWLMTKSVALFADVPGGVILVKGFSWNAVAGYFAALALAGALLGLLRPYHRDELAALGDMA